MTVTYELQLTDWQAADRFFAKRRPRLPWRDRLLRWFFYAMVGAAVVVPLLAIPLNYIQSPAFQSSWKSQGIAALLPISFVLIPIGCIVLLWLGAPLLQSHGFRQSPLHQKQIILALEPEGIRGEQLIYWSQIYSIDETNEHIFIRLSDHRLLIVPCRAFESDFASTQFAARCREGRQKALN